VVHNVVHLAVQRAALAGGDWQQHRIDRGAGGVVDGIRLIDDRRIQIQIFGRPQVQAASVDIVDGDGRVSSQTALYGDGSDLPVLVAELAVAESDVARSVGNGRGAPHHVGKHRCTALIRIHADAGLVYPIAQKQSVDQLRRKR